MNLKEYGAKLKTARLACGLTLEAVAQRMEGGITKQALSQYENGKIKPSPLNELQLCLIYDIRKETLYEQAVRISGVAEVKMRPGISLNHRDSGKAAAEILRTVNDREGLFGDLGIMPYTPLADMILPVVPGLPADSSSYKDFIAGRKYFTVGTEKDAHAVRSMFGLDMKLPVQSVCDLIEQTGIVPVPLDLADFTGASGYCADIPFIAYCSAGKHTEQRWTIVYEFARILLSVNGIQESDGDSVFRRKAVDMFCELFAREFLFPQEAVNRVMLLTTKTISRHHIADCEFAYMISTFGLPSRELLNKLYYGGIIPRALYFGCIALTKAAGGNVLTDTDYAREEEPTLYRRCLECCRAEGIMVPLPGLNE
jgi:transcriptional regulator with XRE-family HTH domain